MLKTTFILLLIGFVTVNGKATRKKVCIVGAGVSGLVSAKHFNEYPKEFDVVVFEKNSNSGGVWIYTNSTTVDEHGLPVHSSLYKNVKTNGVKPLMTFPDYPHFGDESTDGRFIKHELVLEYLRNYTDHFNLRQLIKFNNNVEKILPLPHLKWLTFTRNLNDKKISKTVCDAIIVCNGHNFKGFYPKIEGIEKFTGNVLHSHVYRVPEPFTNQTVVVLGASYSGQDISVDISPFAKKVYLSHRHDKNNGEYPSNIEQVPCVVGAEADKLILSNGTKIRADVLVYCTGYVYDFPFLEENSGIVVEKSGKHIHWLYKHMINVERPTMAFIDLAIVALHFQLGPVQANYFRKIFIGELSLPSHEQMLLEAQKDLSITPANEGHIARDKHLKYYHELVREAGGNHMPWWTIPYLEKLNMLTFTDPIHMRDRKLVIYENNRTVDLV